ncbi:MAG: InlB B-repeat-containing protein, partial [Ruminococcus sp.]|nr:InlB B-repeat-containing protein [Ruminococcus sp.]
MKLKRLIYILCGCTAALVVAAAVSLPFATGIKGTPENEKYIVCFNTQGGNAIENIEVDANGKIQQPANPILEGYVFKGWYKDSAGTELFDFEKDTIGANTFLYAKWELATTLEVHFNAMGGSTVQNTTASRDGLLTRPKDPEKLDYIFAGWYQNEECSVGQEWNFDSDIVTSPMTLYAKWVAVTGYVVHFNTMGGNSIDDIDAPKGGTISAPAEPSKAGYRFAGWYQDEDCSDGQEWNFATDKVSSNMTLYAKWIPNGTVDTYTVTFVTNSDSVINPITNIESGSKIKEPTKPTKEGYTFIAWHQDKDCLDEPWDFNKDIVEDNITLYAEWSSAAYKISYVTEYGIKPTSTTGTKLPSEFALLSERGHVFCGWYLDAEFKTKATAGVTIESDTTLYAKWRDKTKYDELLEEKDFVLVNDDFDNYSVTDRLPKFESWAGSEPGIYYDTHVGSSSTVQPSDTTTYIQMENGVANLMDTSNGASVQLVLNSGEITSGIIEGYFEVTLKDSGNSWTFFQLYGKATNGKDAAKVDELFGLRVDSGNIKYRVNGGSTYKDGSTQITCSDKTYKVYFTIDMEAQSLSLIINDGGTEFKNYLSDFKEIQFTSVNGFKFTSSDNGNKTMSADYLIMNNMNLSLADYKARMKKQAQDDYDALDIANQYPSSQTALSAVLSTTLSNIDSKTSISEVKKAYDDYLVELDNAILSAQKQKLANELENYVDASLYT